MPDRERANVLAGGSAKKALAHAKQAKQRAKAQAIFSYEVATGKLSDKVAKVVIAFCLGGKKIPKVSVIVPDVAMLLNRAEGYLAWPEREIPKRRTKRKGLAGLFARLRPGDDSHVHYLELEAEWLANVIRAIAPQRFIWEQAFRKAQRRLTDLEIKKRKMRSPMQVWREREERTREIQIAPTRRRVFEGGAQEWLGRQGSYERKKLGVQRSVP